MAPEGGQETYCNRPPRCAITQPAPIGVKSNRALVAAFESSVGGQSLLQYLDLAYGVHSEL